MNAEHAASPERDKPLRAAFSAALAAQGIYPGCPAYEDATKALNDALTAVRANPAA